MRNLFGLLAVTSAVLLSAGSAMAAPFGNYTSGLNFSNEPTYSFGSTTGTVSFDGAISLTAQTGAFTGVTSGKASGTLQFSMTQTATIASSPVNVLSFTDPANSSGPLITFTVQSVETVGYSMDPNNGDTIQLYILGDTAGGATNASGALSSFVLNLYGLSGTGFTTAATLSDPPEVDPNAPAPSPVPEPATLAILGAGLVGMGILRRRSSKD